MQFNFNKKQAQELAQETNFQPLPSGNYELIIKRAEMSQTPNGTPNFEIVFTVRNDLDAVQGMQDTNAKYHNRNIFMHQFKSKKTNDFPEEPMMLICNAASIPDGTQINSMEQLGQILTGRAVRGYIKKGVNSYNNKTENSISPFSLEPTKFPQVNHQWKTADNANSGMMNGNQFNNQQPNAQTMPNTNQGNGITVDDNDLPF